MIIVNSHTLRVSEIYLSVQGESSFTGLPCWFVRLTGCPLRCKWCDTAYAFQGGEDLSIPEVIQQLQESNCKLVEITGGEPLAQEHTPELIKQLKQKGFEVLIETSGSEDISLVVDNCHVIMDIKCPDSKMSSHNRLENLEHLKKSDEIKFVIASEDDYQWAIDFVKEHSLDQNHQVLFSPAWGLYKPQNLAEQVANSGKNIRLNLQTHKYIWSPRTRGV